MNLKRRKHKKRFSFAGMLGSFAAAVILVGAALANALRHPTRIFGWIMATKARRAAAVAIIIICVAAPLYYFYFARSTEAAWWNDMWRYRKKLTIDHDYVAGELQNFPVLVSLTDTDLASAAQSDGDDIAFTDGDGNKFAHEIESYTSSTGVLVAWVKIPNLTPSHDMDIYMYYGNPTCQTQQAPTDVWDDNFKMVQHLADTGTGDRLDSTENNNDGVTGSYEGDESVDARVGKGNDLDGTDTFTIAHQSYFNQKGLTFSAWARFDQLGYRYIARKGASAPWGLTCRVQGDSIGFSVRRIDSTEFQAVGSVVTATWYHITGVFGEDNLVTLYVNGSQVDQKTFSGELLTDANGITVGGSAGFNMDGIIDEIRFSNTARSVQWIQTEYNNQNSPSTFLSINSVQQERPGLPAGYWPFSEGYGATTHDESGSGNNATITGATWAQESECVSGKCLRFDGSGDEVDAGDVSY